MGKIIWLVSYPKSGNTWLRAFLTNYLRDTEQPADINDLAGGPIASARPIFDDLVGVEAADLTLEEIELLRPAVYAQMAQASEETLYLKAHDAFTYNGAGQPLFSKAATRGAIYLIRNPLDVAVSFAGYFAISLDRTVQAMADPQNCLAERKRDLPTQLCQRLLTWSGHVQSWIDEPDLCIHVMRYEDMKSDPLGAFGAAVRFAGLPLESDRLQRALTNAGFANLQQQERTKGFQEKAPAAQPFFRKGECGAWRTMLTAAQVDQLIQDHSLVMRRFGYLTEAGEIAC